MYGCFLRNLYIFRVEALPYSAFDYFEKSIQGSCKNCNQHKLGHNYLQISNIGNLKFVSLTWIMLFIQISSSGRFQLVDATGSIDVVCDLPSTWKSNRIFEVMVICI